MKRRSFARELLESAVLSLLVCGLLSSSFESGVAAENGWAPVVVLAAGEKSASQPTHSAAHGAPAHAPTAVKGSPAEPDSARPPVSPPVVRDIKAEPKSGGVAAEAGKMTRHPESSAADPGAGPAMKSLDAAASEASPAQQYCANIADAAVDARFAWQKKTLGEVRQEVDKRIAMLEAKIAEYQKWLVRRDEFSKKANESLIKIYSRMRPDAAAQQLVKMDEETAAAVLLKLDSRNASAILNEIPPAQAARLAGTIAGAARKTPEPKKS